MDGVAESASLLGARMLGAFGSDQQSTWLVREYSVLEEWYVTEALCNNMMRLIVKCS